MQISILTADHWLLTADHWLLTTDCWPLTTYCWPLTADHWPLTTDRLPLTTDHWPLTTDCWPLTTDCWPLTADRWPVTADHWPLTSVYAYVYVCKAEWLECTVDDGLWLQNVSKSRHQNTGNQKSTLHSHHSSILEALLSREGELTGSIVVRSFVIFAGEKGVNRITYWSQGVASLPHKCHLPYHPRDNIRVMVIVWRLRGNIIRTALCGVVWHDVYSQQHAHMSSSYRSSRLGLSHWDPHAMHRGGCLELYYCNTVEWSWWDSGFIWKINWFPSVLWHCWFGHMTCKNRPRYDL